MPIENTAPTGNLYLALPTISASNGGLESFNLLSMRYNGLIEYVGNDDMDLFQPFLILNNKRISLKDFKLERHNYWIPELTFSIKELDFIITYCPTMKEKGFYIKIEINNKSNKKINVKTGLYGVLSKIFNTIYEPYNMNVDREVYVTDWGRDRIKKVLFNVSSDTIMTSTCILSDKDLDHIIWSKEQKDLFSSKKSAKKCKGIKCSKDDIFYKLTSRAAVDPDTSYFNIFYVGVGLDPYNAISNAMMIKRISYNRNMDNFLSFLKQRIREIPDEDLCYKMNLNFLFCYFYSVGKTFDTNEIVTVTSRSRRYYVSSSYWDRDTLLWAFPAILEIDTEMALEIIKYVFSKQIEHIGTHSRYINGTVLENGFELDGLCAPVIALKQYIYKVKNNSLLYEDYIREGLKKILDIVTSKRSKYHNLYQTELLPTDDVAEYPYTTFNNVLCYRMYIDLNFLNQRMKKYLGTDSLKKEAYDIKKSIYRYLIIKDDKYGSRYAWSTDMHGNLRDYDAAPGSVVLLPYYNFCAESDHIYQNSLKKLYSDENKFYIQNGKYKELANLNTGELQTPWVLSVINKLLTRDNKNSIKILKEAPLDNGIACESFDPNDGTAATGFHFATCAGFLAYSIYNVCKEKYNGKDTSNYYYHDHTKNNQSGALVYDKEGRANKYSSHYLKRNINK